MHLLSQRSTAPKLSKITERYQSNTVFRLKQHQNSQQLQSTSNTEYAQELCQRCLIKQQQIQCKTCVTKLCNKCDFQIHNKGKFTMHQRNKTVLFSSDTQTNIINDHLINEINELSTFQNLHFQLTSQNIVQQWNNVIKKIMNCFQQIFNKLNLKKQQLSEKLQRRKTYQLKNYIRILQKHRHQNIPSFRKKISGIPQNSAIQKSSKSDKQQLRYLNKKYIGCEHQDEYGNCIGKLQINLRHFIDISNQIDKLDIKPMIKKLICKQQLLPKKKKSSLMINGNKKCCYDEKHKQKRNLILNSISYQPTNTHKATQLKINQNAQYFS